MSRPTTFDSAGAYIMPDSELEPVAFFGDDGRPMSFPTEEPEQITPERLRLKLDRSWRLQNHYRLIRRR